MSNKTEDAIRSRLYQIREYLGLSQEEFGRRVGYSNPYVSQVERGLRGIFDRYLIAVCNEYDVSQDWLMKGTGPMFVVDPNADSAPTLDSATNEELIEELQRRLGLV